MAVWPFDPATDTHQQYAQAFTNGTYSDLPADQVAQDYSQFVESAPASLVQNVHQEYFQQMPQTERVGLFSGLLGALNKQGVDTQQYGNVNPQQATPQQLGGLFGLAQNSGLLGGLLGGGQQQQGYGQQQQGGGLLGGLLGGGQQPQQGYGQQQGGMQDIMRNPLAQMAISGLLSYAVNRAMNGGLQGLMGGNQNQQPQQSYGQQPQQNSGQQFTGGGDF